MVEDTAELPLYNDRLTNQEWLRLQKHAMSYSVVPLDICNVNPYDRGYPTPLYGWSSLAICRSTLSPLLTENFTHTFTVVHRKATALLPRLPPHFE